MPQARASAVYISAAANRHNHASDVSSESLVVFGSSKLVAIWDAADVHDRGVVETLPGHDGLVTGVQFVRDDLFASADDKGSIKWWKKNGAQWVSTGGLQAHSKAISSLCILGNLFVTGGSDAVVKIWRFNDHFDTLEELQIIPLKGKYPLSVALAYLPGSKAIILAIASTDRNVQILTRSDDVFVPSAALSGHEDWVRSLSFRVSASETDPLVLASGSQDGTIRLWNVELLSRDIKALQIQSREPLSDQLLDDFEASLGDLADAEEGGRQISLKRHILTVKTEHGKAQQFSITFDALLVGHEAGITSLSWRPDPASLSIPTLLSTSTDSSLILWSPSTVITLETESSSIWINRQRFGDIGGQRLGGFVGGLWARHGNEVMAWGWAGGWRRWKCQNIDNEVGDEEWSEIGAIGGHNGPVKGIDWSPKGGYLISAGQA